MLPARARLQGARPVASMGNQYQEEGAIEDEDPSQVEFVCHNGQPERDDNHGAEHVTPRSQSSQEQDVSNPYGDAWREFDYDTPAGRLLAKLYTRTHNKPLKNYPAITVQPDDLAYRPNWFTGKHHIDPRIKTERQQRERKVVIPRRKVERRARPAILSVPKRKSSRDISKDIEDIREDRNTFRPLPRKVVSTEIEKRKLAMQFQFKGGKALPECGTMQPIEGHVPLSMITGRPAKQRPDRASKQRAIQLEKQLEEKRELEQEFDQVFNDIETLRHKIAKAQESHGSSRAIPKLKSELQMRVGELEAINKLLKSV